MKTIIAGSRSCRNIDELYDALSLCGWEPTSIVSGTADGADRLGEQYAESSNLPLVKYPADWGVLGKRAGYVRNSLMADNAEALIALWDGISKGTKHMIDIANTKGLKVYVHIIK